MVQLAPMQEEEYQAYLDYAIAGYAEDKVRAGNWRAEGALERSREEFMRLLPQGLATPDHYLFTIIDIVANTRVGVLWFAVVDWGSGLQAFVYDFEIDEPYRRRGYATRALQALEEKVIALGLPTISLHVFGHNHAARALYEKKGYEITNINMTKTVDAALAGRRD